MELREIGKGMYGCVYYNGFDEPEPGVELKKKVTKVTKVMSRKVYTTELKNSTDADRIDPEGKYHCLIVSSGKIPEKYIEIINTQCFISSHSNSRDFLSHYITYVYGGNPIGSLNLGVFEWRKMIRSLSNVVEGLKLFNENGLLHRDIHPENIVYDGRTSKLIDFGNSIEIKYENPHYQAEFRRFSIHHINKDDAYNLILNDKKLAIGKQLTAFYSKKMNEIYDYLTSIPIEMDSWTRYDMQSFSQLLNSLNVKREDHRLNYLIEWMLDPDWRRRASWDDVIRELSKFY